MRREVVPEHGGIFQICLRVAFLRVNENRKLGRISEEEDRSVVEYPIPVALFRVQLDRKSSRISG